MMEKEVKFTQIMTGEGKNVYALDENGHVWTINLYYNSPSWTKLPVPVVESERKKRDTIIHR